MSARRTAIIACGALVREIREILKRHNLPADVYPLPALLHNRPGHIAPAVEEKIKALGKRYARIIVAYGDCGTGGALDRILARYPHVERLSGPHCYEMYGGREFTRWAQERPGTFFLTDFLARGFRGLVWKQLGLDRHPELRDIYFRHYTDVVWLAQRPDPETRRRAEEAARLLGLPLTVIPTGYGALETRLLALLEEEQHPPEKENRGEGSEDEVPETVLPRLPDHDVQGVGQGGEEAAGTAENDGQRQELGGDPVALGQTKGHRRQEHGDRGVGEDLGQPHREEEDPRK